MNKTLAPLLLLFLCGLAAFMGLALPVVPLRLSLVIFGGAIALLLVVVILLVPNSKRVPYGLIFVVFAVAIVTRFLWPNFAYLPIPALPIKNPQRLIWLLAIGFWLYTLSTNRELRERLARRCAQPGIAWMVFVLFGWRVLSMAFSEYAGYGFYLIARELFDFLMIFLFALTWVRGVEDVMRIGRWLLAATAVICGLAAVEYFRQQNLFLAFVPHDPNNEEFQLAALEAKLRGGLYRVQASFNHPLLLAQFLSVVLPVLMLSLWADRSRAVRTSAFVTLLVMVPVLWATQTRTALGVSAFVGALALLLVALHLTAKPGNGNNRSNLLAAIALVFLAAVGVAIAVFLVQLAMGRTAEESASSLVRIEMLQRAIKATQEEPLVGLGPGIGGYEAAAVFTRGRATLDSYWLIVLLESGVPAIALFLALLAAGARHVVTALQMGLSGEGRILGAWALAVLSFAVSSSVLGTPHNLPLLYLALAVIVALRDREPMSAPVSAPVQAKRTLPQSAWR
jgi:O-antigen ligase